MVSCYSVQQIFGKYTQELHLESIQNIVQTYLCQERYILLSLFIVYLCILKLKMCSSK